MDVSSLATVRRFVAAVILVGLSGCAVIKTTDVTDASFKRHQSIAILGWPLYSRVTDQDRSALGPVATSGSHSNPDVSVRAAELLGQPLEVTE
jgi:hypothetical protein